MVRDTVIEVEGLTVRFGENLVLDQVSLTVERGEVVVVAGGSGCGKSTLLKNMIGLYRPQAGRVVINGVEIVGGSEDGMRRVHRQVGVLFQSSALFGSFTVLENVALPIKDFTGLSPLRAELLAKAKLAMVGLAGYENHLPSEISGGMMKRAALARAMALDPQVLFFDEPSAGLDPVTAAGLDRLIKRINRGLGTTMVIVTHELASIFEIAHRVILLDKGVKGIVAQGSPQDLRDQSRDPRVMNFFQRLPERLEG